MRKRTRTIVLPGGERRRLVLADAPPRQVRAQPAVYGPPLPDDIRQQREAAEEQQRIDDIAEATRRQRAKQQALA